MKGRKPIPTPLKVLSGNPGKRPLPEDEPEATGLPECPEFLTTDARAEWDLTIPQLANMGVIGSIDCACLAAYCVVWARWVKAEKIIAQTGEVLKGPEGGLYQNPYLAVANRAMEQMTKLASEFGMTAASRARVKAVKKTNAPTKARFFAG